MERVTEAQIRTAHNGTDSMAYKLLLEQREAQIRQDAVNRAAGCLIREGKQFGFSSLTPLECPVEGCAATFERGGLRVAGQRTCQSPEDKPQPTYPG